jgi:hypothetical protein
VGVACKGVNVAVVAGVLVAQEARINITTIDRIVFMVDMLPSLPSAE